MKEKFLASAEKFAKAMVQPLMYLSVAGMILIFGVLLTNTTVTQFLPFLKWTPIQLVGKLIYECIMILVNNLGIIFCIGIAAALAKKEKHQASIIAFMSYLMFLKANNITLKTFDMLKTPSEMLGLIGTGQASVLGIQVSDMGVFSGIIIGCLVGYVFNKSCDSKFKGYWAMYSGTRFSFILMILVSIALGVMVTFVWPIVAQGIQALTVVIKNSGSFGLFIYGFLERLLIPTGLHHLVYVPFQFTDIGGVMQVGEQTVAGAYAITIAEFGNPAVTKFSDTIYYMATGFTKTFGYIGIALAFYKTAFKENKQRVKALLMPLAITACLSGVTEPFDFLFIFAAPVLYVIHSAIAGLFIVLLKVFNVTAMLGGGIITITLNNLIAGIQKTNWPIMFILGLVQIAVYFVLFSFIIKKFNLKTPGREDVKKGDIAEGNGLNEKIIKSVDRVGAREALAIINGLGGKENIVNVTNCFTRLRVDVKDLSLLNEEEINKCRNSGIVKRGNNVQIIFGIEVPEVRKEVEDVLLTL